MIENKKDRANLGDLSIKDELKAFDKSIADGKKEQKREEKKAEKKAKKKNGMPDGAPGGFYPGAMKAVTTKPTMKKKKK